ncbi:LysR family transcriptional regulator [Nocardia sp. NPDC056100]|uniref:LysR family transcriptional regulator n=1 Tax=Nocardia sp. NPDC056100 TaxID=3345712 RepID=UPI0035E02C82
MSLPIRQSTRCPRTPLCTSFSSQGRRVSDSSHRCGADHGLSIASDRTGSTTIERYEIETFLALAEELHFRRASERLGLSTGRVSQTVKRLERRVGVPLFDRTSRQVALTATGQRLRDDLQPAYESVQRAVARAIEFGRGITCTLHIGYSTPWVADLLGPAADAFRVQRPDCEITIHEVQVGNPLGGLRSGDLDLQISEFPVHETGLAIGPVVLTEPRALMVPARHPLARRDTVSLEDLADVPLVSIHGAVPGYWLDAHLPLHTPSGRPIPQGPTATYWTEIPTLVAAGRGVSPVAACARLYYSRPGIAFVPFRDAPPIEYGLLRPIGRDSAPLRTFITMLLEVAAAHRETGSGGLQALGA